MKEHILEIIHIGHKTTGSDKENGTLYYSLHKLTISQKPKTPSYRDTSGDDEM